jgi:hypothetical protein
MPMANLALRFLLELAGLAAYCYWGFTVPTGLPTKLLVGLGLPVVAAVLWGVFASPKATVPLPDAAKLAFEVVWFGAAAVLLAAAGRLTLAIVFAVLVIVNRILLHVWPQPMR